MNHSSILSRHRLPQPYRTTIVVLWMLPSFILFGALLVGNGFTLALLHPVLLLPLVAMGAPALYVWHEGIDVMENGLQIRIRGWRRLPYDQLDTYYVHDYHGVRLLKLWDVKNQRVLTVYTAHLTEVPTLLNTLKQRLRWRGWHV
jgi:hypothetical protein